jgi:hypothetical protein
MANTTDEFKNFHMFVGMSNMTMFGWQPHVSTFTNQAFKFSKSQDDAYRKNNKNYKDTFCYGCKYLILLDTDTSGIYSISAKFYSDHPVI